MLQPVGESISFERAGAYYDRTRSIGADAMAATIELLTGELSGRAPCLEIGVGTGRMALPLAGAGASMVGVDLAHSMVRELVRKAGGRKPFPLAFADATRLPFRDAAFGAGLAAHVLHLVPAWRSALEELVRVIGPGGVLLVNAGGWGESWRGDVARAFAEAAGRPEPWVGVRSIEDVDAVMSELGARSRVLPHIVDVRSATVASVIDDLEAGVYSFTWTLEPAQRMAAAHATREWAERNLGNVDAARTSVDPMPWRAYDL
jgi:ubiquinone/menaquinone biosynthesis C-methylase UbiE